MKHLLAVLGVLALSLAGCGGLYSSQKFGPQSISGQTLQELIQNNGCPDVVGGNGQQMIVGWYRTQGLQVLGLFATVDKKAMGALIDANGRVVATGTGPAGHGITVLGSTMAPVAPVETK